MAHLELTVVDARRLAIQKQLLTADTYEVLRRKDTREAILDVFHALRCIQLDPISAVAPTHRLVLLSRLGSYSEAVLEHLRWTERSLFEYWAHAASLVLVEDFPIFDAQMQVRAVGRQLRERFRSWLNDNRDLRDHVLRRVAESGPIGTSDIEDLSERDWVSTGWTSSRNVSLMLDHLRTAGKVVIAGRNKNHRLWDLSERFLPDWTPRTGQTTSEVAPVAAEHALRALGVATARQIDNHFTRKSYGDLNGVIKQLVDTGRFIPAVVQDDAGSLPDEWYIHADDVPVLKAIQSGRWTPRTVLLSPFDNLICDRDRTELLWNFHYRIEIYVPKAKRKYGYYVLPILDGDRLIGRIDSKFDRKTGRYRIHNIYAEPGVGRDLETGTRVAGAIAELGEALNATEIALPAQAPWTIR